MMERETGIEPVPSAWKAEVLPLNYSSCYASLWGVAVVSLLFVFESTILGSDT